MVDSSELRLHIGDDDIGVCPATVRHVFALCQLHLCESECIHAANTLADVERLEFDVARPETLTLQRVLYGIPCRVHGTAP